MDILIKPRAIAKTAKMAILAIMATIMRANENFSMAIRGIQLKSMNRTFHYDVMSIFVILSLSWHFYNVKMLIL